MRVLIPPGRSGQILATIAIGASYYDVWHRHAMPGWRRYCTRHGLGLVAFDDDLIARDHPRWKKPTWQKLLVGNAVSQLLPSARQVCYLDTDILVNPTAPNIFDGWDPGTFGLISFRHNTPYPLESALRRMAFLRHTYYSSRYPLDSSLFISLQRLYEFHGLPPQKDEACAGVIVFDVANHAALMTEWFGKYDRTIQNITGGGDQTHVNWEIQNHGRVTWLDYRFQAMWTLEMPWKYPFLYDRERNSDPALVRQCIEASLFTNYFLHFAGSWHESDMWTVGGVLESPETLAVLEAFRTYEATPVTGEPVGSITAG
jgi:hypothetical protein